MRKALTVLLLVLFSVSMMAATTNFVVSIIEKGEETGYGVASEDLESEYAYMVQYYSQQEDFDPVFDGIFLKYELANLKAQRELLNYYALRKGLSIDQLKLEQQVNEVVTNVNNDPEAKPQVEAQYGSMENFYEFVLMVYREDMIRQAAIDDISPMGESAMQEYFDKNKETLIASYEKAKVQHILVETLEQCESIKADILAGNVTFETAAASFSLDQSNSYKGGDLDWFKRGEMVPEFEEACFTAPLNTLTGPVTTEYGFHLILVTDRSGFSTFEEFKASENYETERDKIQAQAVNTWIPTYMVDNRVEFKFTGTLEKISTFAGLYPAAAQSGDYAPVLDFLKNYQPIDADGMIFLEVCYQSMMARNDQTPGLFSEASIEEMRKARLSNLNSLSLVEEYTLAALSRYYSLDPNDSRMAIRFLGKYIDQALELTLDEQIMAYYGDAIKGELMQAYPYLEKIAVDPNADIRDRVVGYTYMIRINNIVDKKDLNQGLLAKILEIDPNNTDVLHLVQP